MNSPSVEHSDIPFDIHKYIEGRSGRKEILEKFV